MSIIRWSPVRDLTPWSADFAGDFSQLHREMNRMLDTFFRGGVVDDGSFGNFWSPAVDIREREDAYLVEVELPGLTKDDVKITMENNILTIQGEKKHEKEEKRGNYHRSERLYGSFQRSFTLPSSVKNEKIEAQYKNGILTVTLPKVEEAKPKAIEVKVS
jgi:HSP20 family protein